MRIELIALATVWSLLDAQLPAPPALTEKMDVTVVNVDVTVMDRHGTPIRHLTRDDFEIFEDGVLQPVSNFDRVEDSAAVAKTSGAAELPRPDRTRKKVLVLIDNINTSAHGRLVALERLEKFVGDHFEDGRYDWSLATVDSGVHLLLPMTSDKSMLHAAIAKIRRMPSQSEMRTPIARSEAGRINEAAENATNGEDPTGENIHRKERRMVEQVKNFQEEANFTEQTMFAHQTTSALGDAARAFSAIEGRKIILLVTGYLPLGAVSPLHRVSDFGSRVGANHVEEIVHNDNTLSVLRDQLIREANAANTSFYIISAEGNEVPEQSPVTLNNFSAVAPQSNALDTSAASWLAAETGGAYMTGNRMDESFAEFDRRSANYYALGFVARHPDDGRYRRTRVRVKNHPEYQLQYRDGYSGQPIDEQLRKTLKTMLGVSMQPSTLNVSLTVDQPRYKGAVAIVPLFAALPMESLQYVTDATGSRTRLHVYVSVFDRAGRNITVAKSFADIGIGVHEQPTGPMTLTIPPLAVKRGTYQIVVAVRDELTDHIGVVMRKIDV
jgi:VWFA-related protein